MRTRRLSPFGTEVRDVALDRLCERDPEGLRRLICEARVCVFRDQDLSDAGFVRVLQALGDMMFTEGETEVAGQPELNVVTNVGRDRPPRSVFHTDTSYVDAPPAFTALRAVDVPERGGETVFSDQIAVFAALPEAVRKRLRGRRLRHAGGSMDVARDAAWHPLVRRHPVTGEAALFLSTPARCDRIEGLGETESRRIIELLYRRSTRAHTLLRHRWRPGDVVFWDDRTTLHKGDHSAVVGARTFHRGMVRGERPVAA